eukprot:gene57521-76794_t
MLTDFIVATRDDIPAILNSSAHSSIWPTLEAKGVDRIKLASLRFILKGEPPDDGPVIEYLKLFDLYSAKEHDGPWIEAIPSDLVFLLTQISPSGISSAAIAWANTEEARLDRWQASDVASLLRELSALAASALVQNKALLLWVCL